ncbi:MAG: response regulator transcription factor [Clostridia bacterium]|nr:response regulator transcription factor [Clostridia bacterium]
MVTGVEPIKVIIADDDAGMRLIERKMIGRVEGFVLAGEAQDGEELLRLVEEKRPQIVFLDVEMPGRTGVECARVIQDMDPSIVLIFATAHDQYMGDAFEVYAFDYLIKPFKVDRVMKTLERARDRIGRIDEKPLPELPKAAPKVAAGRLMLRHRDGVSFISMEDILLVQREDRSTVIYTRGGGRFVTSDSLGETEARLDPAVFFRCHKSYIINLNQISNITPYGRWTYIVRLEGTEHDALITHEKYEELERMFS